MDPIQLTAGTRSELCSSIGVDPSKDPSFPISKTGAWGIDSKSLT